MKQPNFVTIVGGLALLSLMVSLPVRQAHAQNNFVPPVVFQAAGPTISSIEGLVDEFRAALGETNNASNPGPLGSGRREINWDGGGGVATTASVPTPFTGFQITRGALFTTPGSGFVQAIPEGLATTFGNSTYETIFQTFSPLRLFSPVGSNVTDVRFFVPGGGNIPATVTGFGAVFTDIDQPGASGPGNTSRRGDSTRIDYFDVADKLVFSSFVPASPGDGSLSFFGVVFEDARIARVRIRSGEVAPGPNDDKKRDIVVMDDFIYGEPQEIP
jgi:hypothetical protein